MVKVRLAASLFLAPVLVISSLQAQTPADAGVAANPGIIRAEAREVVLEVTVGGKGAAAGELTAKDFSVWEDGKPQKINSASLLNGTSTASAPAPSPKHFAIVLDFANMSLADQAAARTAATNFIDAFAGPDRYIAVTGPHVLQNFTTAKTILKQAVANTVSAKGSSGPPAKGSGGSLWTLAHSMQPAPGRKAILLFTGGYGNAKSEFKDLLAACNRADIAVYVIVANPRTASDSNAAASRDNSPGAPRGTLTPSEVLLQQATRPLGGAPSSDVALGNADLLAEGTGGLTLALSQALPNQLAALARDQDVYRLAYTPPPSNDGACHKLRIVTDVRGLTTRARNEYCTEKALDLVAGKIDGQALESRTTSAATDTGATMQLPWVYTGTNRASVYLSIDTVPAGMKFTSDKDGFHGKLDFVGTTTRADGGVAERFAETVEITRPDQQQADAFTHVPYHYEHQFALPAGNYVFQMLIGMGPNAVGKLETPVSIDPWDSSTFGIGGIALSTEVRTVDPDSEPDAPSLEGLAPLVARGKQFVPAATNRFAKSQRVYFYTEINEPALASATPSTLSMQVRVLDRKTGEAKLDTGMAGVAGYIQPGNPVVPFATAVPVAQLPPGSYRLEVRAAHSSGPDAVTRTADFEVN